MREDKIISTLIGLIGACNNNPKTADTDGLIIKALAFPLVCPGYDDSTLQGLINDIHSEKNAVAPGCAMCAAPCGNTSDYDMRRIYETDDEIREVKLQILAKLQKLAAYVYRDQGAEASTCSDNTFFYKALAYVSSERDAADLLEILDEAKNIEHTIQLGRNQK